MGFHYYFIVTFVTNFLNHFKPLSISLLFILTALFFTIFIVPVIGQNNNNNFQLTEENTRFTFQRCQNESNAATGLLLLWNVWKFPNNKITHCYIKCILYKLGLINLKDMGLNEEKLMFILKRPNTTLDELSIADSKRYDKLIGDVFKPLDSTCESYYRVWIYLIEQFGINDVRNGFTKLKKRNIPKSKAIGQRASDFCYNYAINYSYSGSTLSSLLYKNSNKCLEKCIYQYFHFIDAYGRVDVKEILQSYLEANQSSPELGSKNNVSSYKEEIEKCAHYANSLYYEGLCIVTSKLHKCLMENAINYKVVFKFRDKITEYY